MKKTEESETAGCYIEKIRGVGEERGVKRA